MSKKNNKNKPKNKKEKYADTTPKFPVRNTIFLVFILIIQVALIFIGIIYKPQPQDVIHQYDVTVKPLEDGSLDIEYHFVWEALDEDEELTWVEIGMANPSFSVYPESLSSNIGNYSNHSYDGYACLTLDFNETYIGGDIIEFSFKVNQRNMLCQNQSGYFYEFVPGWFNAIQVKQYKFVWLMDKGEDYIKQGCLDYGEYRKMTIQYGMDDFSGCQTVIYYPFDDYDAYNELLEDKTFAVILSILGAALLIIPEVYIIDSYVSYNRGRGFLMGHGHYVHTFGRSNPRYIRARDRYMASHGGHTRGFTGGGGCACACACACAGGGRAGCSQKDTSEISGDNNNIIINQ